MKSFYIPKTSGQLDRPIHLTIISKAPNASLQWRTLAFTNLPGTYTFSPGIRVDDAHYVSFVDLDKLTITVSKGARPEVLLPAIFLDKEQAKEFHELKIIVSDTAVNIYEIDDAESKILAPVAAPTATPGSVSSAGSYPPAARPVPIDSALENSYVQRAEKLLQLGQIASARLLFEHLANLGSARGALLLGETYDENYLKSLNIVGGVSADKEKAQQWYRKADELGATEAAAHIRRLN